VCYGYIISVRTGINPIWLRTFQIRRRCPLILKQGYPLATKDFLHLDKSFPELRVFVKESVVESSQELAAERRWRHLR